MWHISNNITEHTENTMTTIAKKSSSSIDKLLAAIQEQNTPPKKERPKDERYWRPTVDKAGNGSAVIRFLPSPEVDGDGLPWVRYWDHFFKGPSGKIYGEKSLKSIGKADPIYEENAKLYNANEDPNSRERKQASAQKRRLNYVSNIYVISDPKNPENEGKVFLFRYGKKIFDKISALLSPEFEGEESINPFDLEKGCNFKLRQKQVSGFPNYDDSKFDNASPLAKADKIVNQLYSLKEEVDPKNFKTYDELKARFVEVMEGTEEPGPASRHLPGSATPRKPSVKAAEKEDAPPFDTDDDDPDLEAFRKLADE